MDVTFDKMSGSIGSLLLLWARVERAARDEVVSVKGKSAHGIAALLREWEDTVIAGHPSNSLCPLAASALRAELQGPLDIRNGICHGLIGISAAYDGKPATLTWEINGGRHSITWDALQEVLAPLSKADRAISLISHMSLDRLGSRAIDNAENREWWLNEYGLRLPTAGTQQD